MERLPLTLSRPGTSSSVTVPQEDSLGRTVIPPLPSFLACTPRRHGSLAPQSLCIAPGQPLNISGRRQDLQEYKLCQMSA